MKHITFYITLGIIIQAGFFIPVEAQFMNKLKKAVGHTLEDHAVNQINRGISKGLTKAEDKMWDSLFGVKKSSMDSMMIASQSDPEAYEKMMESLSGGGEPIPISDVYSFESRIVYKMNSKSGKKSSTMDYTVLISPDQNYMATQMGSMEMDGKKNDMASGMTTIMDYENDAMVMIMEKQKMAQIMSLDMISSIVDTVEASDNHSEIIKTGKTKKILGYSCDEYQITSDNVEGSIWIAPDLPVMSQALFKNMGKSNFAKNSDWLDQKGMMMEMDMMVNEEESKKQSHMKMTVISMDEEHNSFAMADYQTMNFGGGMKK